jgi:hypothetical protein
MPITNGSISYERRVKTGDFEHKHAAVTVHYAADEGEDIHELIRFAGSLATTNVFTALRAKAIDIVVSPVADTAELGPVSSAPEPAAVVSDPVVPAAEPVVQEVLPPVTNLKAAKRRVKAAEVVEAELIALVEDIAATTPVETLMGVTTLEEIVAEDFVAEAPAASDAELGQALSRVAAKLKDRPKIQALIGEFVQSGQSYTLIPNSRRAEFITKLEALA